METHDHSLSHKGPGVRSKLLTPWEEEQLAANAPYAKHLRLIGRLLPELTRTEQRVCAGIKLYKLSREIGELLGIGENTVNNHRSHFRAKLGFETDDSLSSYLLSLDDGQQ
jgi:DNA-binding CsgD family transcriptional regulator